MNYTIGPIKINPTPIYQANDNNKTPKRILVVDDNLINIKVAKKALDGFGYIIDECYDGQQCLDLINSGNKYDLIIMDIMMPVMDGEEAIKRLKAMPDFNIPTIALTADAVEGARERYLADGFDEYMPKPFTKEQIQTIVNMLM